MQGLMQHGALTLDKIIDHAAQWHGGREVVTRSVEGPIVRTTYREIHDRAKRVSNLLLALGIKPGDRVGTLAWNTGRHIETWYGIMGIGAVCHTLNPRLFPEQIAWIADHGGDKVIFTDLTFLPIIAGIIPRLPNVEHVIVFTDRDHMPENFQLAGEAPHFKGLLCYEDLIAEQSADCVWGGFDEGTAAGLCYTSGTTGDPKGVMYSHRSNFLHTFITMQPDVMGLSQRDVILPVVPMFHANAWGVAFSAPATGAKIVMPGARMDGAAIHELLETEGVTFSAAVPTVWQMLLQHLESTNGTISTLKKVVIGGAACPETIIRAFQEKYGVEVVHAWGMTETSPVGTLSTMTDALEKLPYDQQMPYRLKQGRPPMGVELKLTDDDGKALPHDGKAFGHLKIRGPIIAAEYFRGAGGKILDEDGFFDTGDVATIDEMGFMQITDRAKDVVKSGGEWISTIEIENIAVGHPKAALAAVIGVPHPKWDERPILLVKLKEGETATKEEFLDFLQGKIAKWWMPDDVVFVDEIPLGATGKIDKKVIRQRMKDYVLPTAVAAAGAATLAAADGAAAPVLYAPEPASEEIGEPDEPVEEVAAEAEPVLEPAHEPEVVAARILASEAVATEAAEAEVSEPEPASEPVTAEALAASLPDPEPVAQAVAQDPEDVFPHAPLVEPDAKPLAPTPEAAFDAPPVFVAEEAPLAMPIQPGRKAKAAKPDKAASGGKGDWASPILLVAVLVAALPAVLIVGAALGARFGGLDKAIAYDLLTRDLAPRIAWLSLGTDVLALIVAMIGGIGRHWKRAVLALGMTAATLGVLLVATSLGGRAAPVGDVATDWKAPLAFSEAVMNARGEAAAPVLDDPSLPVGSELFAGRRVAEVNAETCPAARTLVLERSPADAYEAAKTAVQAKGLKLVTDDPIDGRLEAGGESFWFGMRDDLVIRVRPDTAGARVDIRSVARDAGGDLGRNCGRVSGILKVIGG
ncbi:long-chain-fatty-acid--CoA ligase [Caulobacter hibisci]|uniref:Long-chain-fatty-acid--CoA ligase n=1 Tax=Caulobacter hibisci TaxID=2035993 RepID=A0ABS0SWF0_9CAUL|nr:long-chain-fatty-acid--CoA ligase [Caulobacter hibisci]MBI1683950.1 long-chain-fatty-acid--CoA ligase [Caulobacter hibisci]